MNKIKLTIIAFAALLGLATFTPAYVSAVNPADQIQSGVTQVGGGGQTSLQSNITSIINIMLYIIGILAVILIIVGGIRYTTSAGDSGRIKASKDTIMYAIVGLVVAILAYAIVNFVVDAFI